jgi:hypothetical protein
MKFYICDEDRKTPCVFSEHSFNRLKADQNGMARCIRHGALVTGQREAHDRETLKGVIQLEMRLREIEGGLR